MARAVLHTYAQGQGCCNHLLWAIFEDGEWLDELERQLQKGLEQVVGKSLSDTQRQLPWLRLKEGGLAFGSLRLKAEAAFLSSWALLLKEVAGVLCTNTVEALRSFCPTVWGHIAPGEWALRTVGGNDGKPMEWSGMLDKRPRRCKAFGARS